MREYSRRRPVSQAERNKKEEVEKWTKKEEGKEKKKNKRRKEDELEVDGEAAAAVEEGR